MKNGITANPLTANANLFLGVGRSSALSIAPTVAPSTTSRPEYRITAGTLPTGLTFNTATGAIEGTTTTKGTYTFTAGVAYDTWVGGGNGNNAYTAQYTLTVGDLLTSAQDLSAVAAGEAFSSAIALDPRLGTISGNKTYTLIGALPAGLELTTVGTDDNPVTATALISGTPTESGIFDFSIRVVAASTGNRPTTYIDATTSFTLVVSAGEPEPETKYDVTFAGNYTGATDTVVEVVAGEKVAPVTPYRAGYIFTGWFTDADATTAVDFSQGVTAAKTVYAGWKAISDLENVDPVDNGGGEIKAGCGSVYGIGGGSGGGGIGAAVGLILAMLAVGLLAAKRKRAALN
jgi:uncharacterized repeat protein (TIGR02543 family)